MDLDKLKIDRNRTRRRRRSPWIRRVVVLAVLAGAVWLLRAPLLRFYNRITLPLVQVARAVKTSPLAASAVSGTAANGYIVATRRAALSADTPGRVVELNVEEGSVVKAGTVVARLYSQEYQAAVRRAEGELASAEAVVEHAQAQIIATQHRLRTLQHNVSAAEARVADMEALVTYAKLDHAREIALLEKEAGTQDLVDRAKSTLDSTIAKRNTQQALVGFAKLRISETEAEIEVAKATLKQRQAQVPIRRAQVDEANAFLEKTEVRAPFDGVVILKDAEVGEVVSPNSQGGSARGAVVTMVDFASLEAQVDLPEKSLSAVALGSVANIYLDAYPQIRYTGTVNRIWPTANRQKGTIELRIRFDLPDERLRPEMSVRVVFRDREEEDTAPGPQKDQAPVVLISEDCVTRIDGCDGVFALDRDVACWRPVELGDKRGGRVVVKSGLEGGESLITNPPVDLKDGARVRVQQ